MEDDDILGYVGDSIRACVKTGHSQKLTLECDDGVNI